MRESRASSAAPPAVRFASALAVVVHLPHSVFGLAAQPLGKRSQASAAPETLGARGNRTHGTSPAKALHQKALDATPSGQEMRGSRRRSEFEQSLARRDPPLALADRGEKAGTGSNATGSLDCIENNGGSCMVQSCYSWRGNQTCHLGRCFCTSGQCAGTDGMCHEQQNLLVADHVRLRNVRFPGYHLYMSNYNFEMWVGTNPGNQADFDVRQVPNGGSSAPPDFLLTSSRYTGYAVTIRETQDCDTNNHCTYKKKADSEHIVFPMDKGIQYLAMNFERVPERPEAVMITSFMYQSSYLFAPITGWQVDTYDSDPGTGGYWVFEPPLPNETMEKLRTYHGPRCTYFCGLGKAVTPSNAVIWLIALPLLFSGAARPGS